MLMVVGCVVVLIGVVIGWYTVAGSGISRGPYDRSDTPGAGRMSGESPLDSPLGDEGLGPGHPVAPAPPSVLLAEWA